MALEGADFLMYPSVIENDPQDAILDSRDHWRRAMQGHSAANTIPVVACNRVGIGPATNKNPKMLTFLFKIFIFRLKLIYNKLYIK